MGPGFPAAPIRIRQQYRDPTSIVVRSITSPITPLASHRIRVFQRDSFDSSLRGELEKEFSVGDPTRRRREWKDAARRTWLGGGHLPSRARAYSARRVWAKFICKRSVATFGDLSERDWGFLEWTGLQQASAADRRDGGHEPGLFRQRRKNSRKDASAASFATGGSQGARADSSDEDNIAGRLPVPVLSAAAGGVPGGRTPR